MADVRLLIQEEGRSARNLIAFNVPVSTSHTEKLTRKPPSVPRLAHSGSLKRPMKPATRVRSASTGRDKKSELQARYWAFLFGNLQRAVDGIYQTCEEDENISECKEAILVLENYTRDFHNLIEWFKVKWAYENSPPPLRRTPLAWEVRKTSPCRIWNPSMIPKSTSPVPRMSPTESLCRSPIDQIISENGSLDNKMNYIQEEPVQKVITDNKNTVSKNNSVTVKERCKTTLDKGGTQPLNKEKSSAKLVNKPLGKYTSTKTSTDHKVADAKSKLDVKGVSRKVKSAPLSNFVKTSEEQLYNERNVQLSNQNNNESTNKELPKHINSLNKADTQLTSQVKPLATKNDVSLGKNEINGKVKKQIQEKNVDNTGIENKTVSDMEIDISTKENNGGLTNKDVTKVQNKISQNGKRQSPGNNSNVNNKTLAKSSTDSSLLNVANKNTNQPTYSTVSQSKSAKVRQTSLPETPRLTRSKTTLTDRCSLAPNKMRPGTSVMVGQRFQPLENKISEHTSLKQNQNLDINGSVEVLTKQNTTVKVKEEADGWKTVRSRNRRGSTHNLNMSTRFHKPSTATSLPALSIESPSEKSKKNCLTPDGNGKQEKLANGKAGKNMNNEVQKIQGESMAHSAEKTNFKDALEKSVINLGETNSTSVIAAIFKSDAELLEKRIKQFMAAQAEREQIILEEERRTDEADSQRSQQLSDEEASLQRQILELESTEIDVDTDETDGELALEMEDGQVPLTSVSDDISLEDRYENMLEGMSNAERVDTLAQLRALVARHPGRALELHQKLSSPSRKRSLPETLRRYQAKQACAQYKRQKLLTEKSQRLRELLNKVEDVKSAKSQLIEDKRVRMELRLKRAEENRAQHLLEVVRKAHDEDSKLKEIAFINELEAQNKRHDFMALCQEQEERLQGIHEERQRRQEEKAAKEAAAEERRKALEAARQLRIEKMTQARREREERVWKMLLNRGKERQKLAIEKAKDREGRLSALHALQLANQEELQKRIAQKLQEFKRRQCENIEHIRQRSFILRSEEVPPTLKSYPAQKQCTFCGTAILNEVYLLSHLKGKAHLDAFRTTHVGREPSRDELQRFNIAEIREMPQGTINDNNSNDAKAAKEKQEGLKRLSRRLMRRMTQRGEEWESSQKADDSQSVKSSNKAKFRRILNELERSCNKFQKVPWPKVAISDLERRLGEIARIFSKPCSFDHDAFYALNGFSVLTNLLNAELRLPGGLPNKSILSVCRVFKTSVSTNTASIERILMSNKINVILDLVLHELEMLARHSNDTLIEDISNTAGYTTVASNMIQLLCALIPEEPFEKPALQSRVQDIAGYLVCSGLIDRVSRHSRALIEADYFLDQEHEASVLVWSFDLLSRLCTHLRRSTEQEPGSVHENNGRGELTRLLFRVLLSSLSSTDGAGALGALYTAVALTPLKQIKGFPPTLNQATLSQPTRILVVRGLKLLKSIAQLDLQGLQHLLGTEPASLVWRMMASFVITRLSRDPISDKQEIESENTSSTYILTELFQVIGYFAVNNPKNQLVLETVGGGPSILQQLCTLPFPFYGDPRLTPYTLPTLLVATHKNPTAAAILSCEISYQLLDDYRDSESGKSNPLVQLLKDTASP